jgi:adenosylcobinamide-GDP ribazoletransferase
MDKTPRVKRLWADFVAVWTLAARIPVPGIFMPERVTLPSADAMAFLPLAGALLGFLSAIPARAAALFISPQGAAWLAVGIYTILGWSLHLDGWGDLWDGFGSGRRGEELRRVMKDSRAGAFGVAGITLAIGARAALLGSVEPRLWLASCAIAGGTGRFGAIVAVYLGKYPWPEGMARDIVRNFGVRQLAWSALAACPPMFLLPWSWAAGMAASAAGGTALAFWALKNMGGVNGDVAGASAVLGEILAMAGCAALAA